MNEGQLSLSHGFCSKPQGLMDVLRLEVGERSKHLVLVHAISDHPHDRRDGNPQSTQTWGPPI